MQSQINMQIFPSVTKANAFHAATRPLILLFGEMQFLFVIFFSYHQTCQPDCRHSSVIFKGFLFCTFSIAFGVLQLAAFFICIVNRPNSPWTTSFCHVLLAVHGLLHGFLFCYGLENESVQFGEEKKSVGM